VLAVVSFEHVWQIGKEGTVAYTVLGLRGKPTGGTEHWENHYATQGGPGYGEWYPPDAITGLTGDFTTGDAVYGWNGIDNAIGYKLTLTTNGTIRAIEYVPQPSWTYPLERNTKDHGGVPVGSLSVEVRALKMIQGAQVVGSPAVLSLTNPPPPTPTGLVVASKLSHILVSVDAPTFGDYLRTEAETSADDFNGVVEKYAGDAHAAIRLAVVRSGTNYVRVRFVDVFGNKSGWVSAQVEAQLIDGSTIGSISFAQLLGSILEGQIGPNTVNADAIKAGAILSSKLAIGDTVNSFPDPRIAEPSSWSVTGIWERQTGLGNQWFGKSAFRSPGTGTDHDLRTPFFDVLPNIPYVVSFRAEYNGEWNISLYWETDTTSGLIANINQSGTFGGVFVTPANNSRIRFLFRRTPGGYGFVQVGNIVTTRRFGGLAIVDGDQIVSRDIQAGGKVEVTDGSYKSNMRLQGFTLETATQVKVRVGRLDGLPYGSATLPANTFGLWAGQGAGVYLTDYPRVIAAGFVDATINYPSVTVGLFGSVTFDSPDIVPAGFTVPAGKKWLFILQPNQIGIGNTLLLYTGSQLTIGGAGYGYPLPAGTYSNPIKFQYWHAFQASSGYSAGARNVKLNYLILEV
jgi:hypothetical protein